MNFISKICKGDRVIWMIFLLLCFISIVEGYSASSSLISHTAYWRPISRHIIFLLIGVGLVLITHSIHPKYFSLFGLILPIVFILLLITRFLSSSINSSSRWINMNGVSFQPSEIAKLSLVIFTAFLLKKKNKDNEKIIFYLIFIATLLICAVIFIDNASTAIMLFGIVYLMMFFGQISIRRMLMLGSGIIFFGIIFYCMIKYVPNNSLKKIFPRISTWKTRFMSFKTNIDINNPNFVLTDDNYQIVHANIAIANGGFLGRGMGNSSEKNYLPQSFSDFIYSIIVEEIGLLGGIGVLLLYIIFFVRVGLIANYTENLFYKFMSIGIALLFIIQALVNMSVAVNLIPVTGQTLPLISRGGTSTLVNCIYFGIILSISRYETSYNLYTKKYQH